MFNEKEKINSPEQSQEEIASRELTEKPADDISRALELVGHIQNPCADKKGNDLRRMWLRIARETLESDTLKNPYAKQMLEEAVKEYSN